MEQSKRWLSLVEKMGSEEEARAEMRRRAEKSKRNLGGRGGFGSMDKDRLSKVASIGGKKSKRNASST